MDAERIVELFSEFGPVAVRRMFGGAGIYAEGLCIAIVASDDVMYFKVDDGNAAMFDRENCAPFTYPRGGKLQSLYSYRRMPERLYDDPEELAVWARGSFGAALNQRARAGKPKKKAAPRKVAKGGKKAAKKVASAKKKPATKQKAKKKKAAKRRP